MANDGVVRSTRSKVKTHCLDDDLGSDVSSQCVRPLVDDGLQSSSSVGVSGEGEVGVRVLVRDPETMIRGMITCGVSAADAVKAVNSYYDALRVVRVVGRGESDGDHSTTTSKASRMERWRQEVSVMPERPGQCYLHVIRWGRRKAYSRDLGDSPLWRDFVAKLEPGDLDVTVAKSTGFYQVGFGGGSKVEFHIADSCESGVYLGNVYECIACVLRAYPFVNSQYVCDAEALVSGIPLCGKIGMPFAVQGSPADQPVCLTVREVPESPDLSSLYVKDFTVCRCMVHLAPLTKQASFASAGCCKKPSGRAGVIAGAYAAHSRMCHATEPTRVQDKKLLELMLSGEDPGVLDGRARPASLAGLCTSSTTAVPQDFGNGYCYLALIAHDAWWRVARLLGPNPLLSSVMRAMLWVGKSTGKLQSLMEVAEGFYHVVPVKSVKGVITTAGVQVYTEMQDVVRRNSSARIGTGPTESGTGLASVGSVFAYQGRRLASVAIRAKVDIREGLWEVQRREVVRHAQTLCCVRGEPVEPSMPSVHGASQWTSLPTSVPWSMFTFDGDCQVVVGNRVFTVAGKFAVVVPQGTVVGVQASLRAMPALRCVVAAAPCTTFAEVCGLLLLPTPNSGRAQGSELQVKFIELKPSASVVWNCGTVRLTEDAVAYGDIGKSIYRVKVLSGAAFVESQLLLTVGQEIVCSTVNCFIELSALNEGTVVVIQSCDV